MLQVITGMYFREVPVHETLHRRTLYTNALLEPSTALVGPALLLPSTDRAQVTTLTVEVLERLEAVRPDGHPEALTSTGGDELVDDLAAVLSFALGATVTTRHDEAARLVSQPGRSPRDPVPADLLQAFRPGRAVSTTQLVAADELVRSLVGLHRPVFEQALLAVRRIVRAGRRVAEDPVLAYTDYIAALDALAQSGPAREPDPARARRRFVDFVLGHVGPGFFREDAVDAVRPVRATSLRRALEVAYDVRSGDPRALTDLSVRSGLLAAGARTVAPPGRPVLLTHEGLDGLARHVVGRYVARGSTELDTGYRYREHLPSVLRAQLSPAYYLGAPGAMSAQTAVRRSGEVFDLLATALARAEGPAADLRPSLERIEQLLPAQRSSPVRQAMLAVYRLWHEVTDLPRPDPGAVLALAVTELAGPSPAAFVTALLLGHEPGWDVEQWCELAEQRWEQLIVADDGALPAWADAALWLRVARALHQESARREAAAAVARAVESLPGHQDLMDLERQVLAGGPVDLDLRAFAFSCVETG